MVVAWCTWRVLGHRGSASSAAAARGTTPSHVAVGAPPPLPGLSVLSNHGRYRASRRCWLKLGRVFLRGPHPPVLPLLLLLGGGVGGQFSISASDRSAAAARLIPRVAGWPLLALLGRRSPPGGHLARDWVADVAGSSLFPQPPECRSTAAGDFAVPVGCCSDEGPLRSREWRAGEGVCLVREGRAPSAGQRQLLAVPAKMSAVRKIKLAHPLLVAQNGGGPSSLGSPDRLCF